VILDQSKFSPCGYQTLSENLYFSENSYKFIRGFPRCLDVLIGQKPCWKETAAFVLKLFWKPIYNTLNGFVKQIVFKSPNLLAAFRNLFLVN
jgi:hypothetical protein